MLLPSRATIVRLRDGSLVLHSPLAIDDATAMRIDALGEVRFLLAPNCMHWMFLKAAKKRYPNARVFGAPVGAHDKLAQSRVWRLLVRDRAAAARSVSNILRWDFERLVVAHGHFVSDDARERAYQALSWMAGDQLPVLEGASNADVCSL